MDKHLEQAIVDIVGKEHFTRNVIDLVSYACDASEHCHKPLCAVFVESTEQVADIMKLASRENIPVTPRGAGTGLSGMAVPIKGGIVLDLSRMNQILKISIEDRLAVVQPGVVYATLEKALAPHGFFFPPDPASGKVSTLGGNVATNAGGLKGAKYGTTRDYVLALQVVLPDGRIMRTGSKAMKSVSGYDLTRLFVGSEGTLGVVTEITFKINPKPLKTSTALATFDSLEDAGNAINQIMHSGIIPSALEILGRETIAAINQNTDLNLPEVDAMLLVETDGYTEGETEFQIEKVIRIFEDNHPQEVKKAKTEDEVKNLWAARKSAYAVLSRIKPSSVLEDVTVPMTHIAELLQGVHEISKTHDIPIATFGHAGTATFTRRFSMTNMIRLNWKRRKRPVRTCLSWPSVSTARSPANTGSAFPKRLSWLWNMTRWPWRSCEHSRRPSILTIFSTPEKWPWRTDHGSQIRF